MWRHGDIMIEAAKTLPAQAQRLPGGVLARGEATGHAHRIEDPGTAEIWRSGESTYLRVTAAAARLVHEEHHAIELPRGLYRFWPQREYTPQAIRRVVD